MAAFGVIESVSNAFASSPINKLCQQHPDDVVITLAFRTAMTKGGRGAFKDTPLDLLLKKVLQEVLQRSNVDPALVEDISLGNVRSETALRPSRVCSTQLVQVMEGKAASCLRAALLAAGFPNTTSASATARFCGSGLKATSDIANQISAGDIEMGIAVGAEDLTRRGPRLERPFVDEILEANQAARDCMRESVCRGNLDLLPLQSART